MGVRIFVHDFFRKFSKFIKIFSPEKKVVKVITFFLATF